MKKFKPNNSQNISMLSLIYRVVGNLLIGKPESFGQKKDFYDIPIDREMPSPKNADDKYFKENIKTDFVRRKIFLAVGKFTALFSILFFGVWICLFPYMGYYNSINVAVSNFKNEHGITNSQPSSQSPQQTQQSNDSNQTGDNNSLVGGSSSLFN